MGGICDETSVSHIGLTEAIGGFVEGERLDRRSSMHAGSMSLTTVQRYQRRSSQWCRENRLSHLKVMSAGASNVSKRADQHCGLKYSPLDTPPIHLIKGPQLRLDPIDTLFSIDGHVLEQMPSRKITHLGTRDIAF